MVWKRASLPPPDACWKAKLLNALTTIAAGVCALFLLGVAVALYLVASPPPPMPPLKDVFDFTSLRKPPSEIDPPSLRRYPARDGEELAYRIYESTADRILIFVHGSSYHGAGYHGLAAALSLGGVAKVVLPNLRGHYQSGRRRGDIEYIGQLEDDIADLIGVLREQRLNGPITLGGHSSGGGFAIRFAGGGQAALVSSYLLLAPAIPTSNAMRQGTAGGWANLNFRRLYGLLAFNALGIHGFDGLPVIEFNKPPKFWDGTETLAYSHRLNASYHPRFRYQDDIRAMGGPTLVMIGTNDEAIDPEALRALFAESAPGAQMKVLPGVNHFGVFNDPAQWDTIAAWLKALPAIAGR
jgi:non-heme chloroperoxidase